MQINVRGKNIEITPALQEYVDKRLRKLEKYFDTQIDAQTTLSAVSYTHLVKIRGLLSEGMILAATGPSGEIFLTAVDGELPAGSKIT